MTQSVSIMHNFMAVQKLGGERLEKFWNNKQYTHNKSTTQLKALSGKAGLNLLVVMGWNPVMIQSIIKEL